MARNVHHILVECGYVVGEGLYKGVLPSLILVSNPALTYMILEWFQNLFSESANGRKGKMSAGSTFARNAAAKLLATIITYPVMVLKSRLQVSKQKNLDEAQPQLKYRNILDAIVKIVRRVTSSDGGDAQAAAHRQCCCVPCRKDLQVVPFRHGNWLDTEPGAS
eukprot:scaffold2045_cov404-Prasinococcus_capsulatus_cf.AAC.55